MSTSSITSCADAAQEEQTIKLAELPIVGETTEGSDQAGQAEQTERPIKYVYPEFEGIYGERYLLSLAEQFAPLALWRTWHAAVSFQAPGQACYVGVGRIVERVGPKERKIYLDLAALESRGWLSQERARMPFLAKDGSTVYYPVTVKDFTGFYDCAHDYHLWLHDPGYIAPERENVPLILADPELTKRLVKFENYRRILLCGKPGRKKEQGGDYYSRQLAQLAQGGTHVQEVNQYSNTPANTDSPYRRSKESENLSRDTPSILSTPSEKGTDIAALTIRNEQGRLSIEQREERKPVEQPNPKPNTPPTSDGHSGAAAERAKTALGYTEEELKRDPKKRGAAAAGIPADQHAKLTGSLDRAEQREREAQAEQRQSRPERERPAKVVEEIETYARQYDNPELVQSDVTRVLKLYFTAGQVFDYFNDSLYWAFYDEARKAANKYARKYTNRKGRVNRLPYFFACLENAFNFSLEELVFLRTEDPLYTDYSLYDVIDYLRATYQQQYHDDHTRLDYREWLQALLDQLEQRKEAKERSNRTSRDN